MAETRGKTIPFADKTRFYRSELKSLRVSPDIQILHNGDPRRLESVTRKICGTKS